MLAVVVVGARMAGMVLAVQVRLSYESCHTGHTDQGAVVCKSASACTSSLTRFLNSSNLISSSASAALNNTLTCSTIPTVYSSSQLSCTVIQPLLQQLFPLETTLTITRSLNSSRTPGGDSVLNQAGLVGGDGEAWAQLWYDGTEQFYCQASGCDQSVASGTSGVNGSTWVCPTLQCHCRAGTDFCGGGSSSVSQNLTGTIDVLNGPLTVDCSADGSCYFKQTLLDALFGSNGLELSSCSFGECVEQYIIDEALGIATAADTSGGLSGGVIAGLAVVGAFLLGIVGIIIWGFVTQRKARRGMRTDGEIPKAGGAGVKWSGIGYEVKLGKHPLNQLTGWAKGSGSKTIDMENDGEKAMARNGNGKVVLDNASGVLSAGGFYCILGPSGAGKSTLVDILAGKRKSGRIQGRVSYAREIGEGRVKVGYVDQSDILSPTSTVLETLIFAANLRLPETIPKSIKRQRAEEVLHQLGLEHVADTRVGSSERRGISGGEMRRVSIGIELVAAPDVLVLDEPTSGLDSVTAARLVKLLKDLSRESKTTIIASIHQPSSALYRSFDQVALLANGQQLYFGPGGDRPAEFFASQGRPCPAGYNVADHLLEIASGSIEGLLVGPAAIVDSSTPSGAGSSSRSSDQDKISVEPLQTPYPSDQGLMDTPFNEKLQSPIYPPQQLLKDDPNLSTQDPISARGVFWPRSHCATTFLTQIEVLSGREWRNLKRDKTLLVAHIFFACLLGVFAGGLYYKVGVTIAGFQNRVGSLFFLGSLIAFSSLSALYNLVEVRGLFLRERAGNFYSPQAWLFSRVMFDVIPLRLIPTILVGVIVYFMVGLSHHPARFFKFLLILVEYSLGMTLFNFLLACVFRHGGIAILLSSLWNLFLMTYAGFFVNIKQIPPVLRWLRYFSTLGYTLEALSVNEVGAGLQIIDTLAGVKVEVNAIIIMQTLFGFDLGNYYRDVLVLFAFIAGFAVLLVGTVVVFLRESR
ncbi:hypothetical protein BCR39DRAFT_547449 [Naematelia encephala]|uniref:ABC transporter domain-containing protein n=1 Tax=Naematelia encephala TaxID=71784 RepID=A0A1Y2AP33_9TREE|nr:hypothetical protein BCR39DRAFT_547449 [Naematelia encephala]